MNTAIAICIVTATLPPSTFPPQKLKMLPGLNKVVAYTKLPTVSALLHATSSIFSHGEHVLLYELTKCSSASTKLRDMENITRALAAYRNQRVIRALLMKADVVYIIPIYDVGNDEPIPLPSSASSHIRPAGEALAAIGEPVFLPLLNECLRLANDPTQDDHFGELICTLSQCRFVAKALDETTKRLFAKPDDNRHVRACKKVIYYLKCNDRRKEIWDFTVSFPPPWWDKFKE
jgi:hypothetical protein